MKNGRLYQSPEIDFKLLTRSDVLSDSNPIGGEDGFWAGDYDLSGKWW